VPASSASASTTDADAPATDAPATDAPATEAGGEPDAAAPEASDATDADDVAPEDVAAVGGVAAVAGAAAMLGKPSFLPTHTPGGSTPAVPKSPAAPPATGPDGTAPDGTAPDGTAPDGTNPDPGTSDGTTANGSSQDGSKDGEQPDTSQNNRSERTLDEIKAALDEINPNYDPSDPANGYATNCGNTSSIMNDFFNGSPTTESPTGTLDTPQMEARTGNPQTPMTPEQIEASLRALGPGSHCVVGIDRSTGDGHWFNAYFDGTNVWVVDAQPGTMSPWPPNEPNATNWDASVPPEHVAPAAPDASTTPAAPDASAPATPDAPATPAPPTAPAAPADSAGDSTQKSSTIPETAGTREAGSRPTWTPEPTVLPDHASDGSTAPGTTFNGYEIPELTPEVRQQLDALAAQPDSPVVRNEDGSYSLREPIKVTAFQMQNANHDWAEFQRQVGLQQQGFNKLSIAEWQHNVGFYDTYNRVAKSEQAAANRALEKAGITMKGQAVLHGPDQIAGGRPDRFDNAGSFGINSSLGSQWQHRITDVRRDVANAAAGIDATLLPHIKLNIELGAVNVRDQGQVATQTTLTTAQRVDPPSPTASSTTPGTTRAAAAPVEPNAPNSASPANDSSGDHSNANPSGPGERTSAASNPEGTLDGSEPTPESHRQGGEDVAMQSEPAPDQSAQAEPEPEPDADANPAPVDLIAGVCTIEGHGSSQQAIDQARLQAEELYGGIAAENRARMETDPVTIDVIPHGKRLTDLSPYAHLAGLQTFDGRPWEDVRGIQTEVNGVRRVAIAEEGLVPIAGASSGYGPGFLAAHEGGHGLQFSALTPEQVTQLTQLHAARLAASGSISQTTQPGAATSMWLEPAWYSAANKEEYFANSVAAYLGHPYSTGALSVAQYTRSWLKANDPKMFALLDRIYGVKGTP